LKILQGLWRLADESHIRTQENAFCDYTSKSTEVLSNLRETTKETFANTMVAIFFPQNICKPDSCLHHLLPPPRDISVISRLRSSSSLSLFRPISRTKKFESFLNLALLITNHICECNSSFFIVIIRCAVDIVVTVFIYTCFSFRIVNLLFSHSAT